MKKLFIVFVVCFVFKSCSKQNEQISEIELNSLDLLNDEIKSTLLTNYTIPDEDVERLQRLGFSGSYVKAHNNFNVVTEESYISYIVEGDIEIKSMDLINMIPLDTESVFNKKTTLRRQYRTSVVAAPKTYKIIYVSYSGLAPFNSLNITTDPEISEALDLAIDNYNDLNLSISFERIYLPAKYPGKTGPRIIAAAQDFINNSGAIVIKHANLGGAGGKAGFPLRIFKSRPPRFINTPFKKISIDLRTVDSGLNVLEHVITHEIGHCIGFRHTDYAFRRCGDGDRNEGAGSYGAIHIPGTPVVNEWGANGLDTDSVMISCFDNNENGEFSAHDITALNEIW